MSLNLVNVNNNISFNDCSFNLWRTFTGVTEPVKLNKKSKDLLSTMSCRVMKDIEPIKNCPLMMNDISFHIIDVNETILFTSGVKVPFMDIRRKDVVGKKLIDVYPKEYVFWFTNLLNIVKETKQNFHYVVELNSKPYEACIVPVLDKSKELYGYVYFKVPYSPVEYFKKDETT